MAGLRVSVLYKDWAHFPFLTQQIGLPLLTSSTLITMSSTTGAMASSPSEGSSPFVNDAWGLRLFGPEPYPPFVGEGEFAIINPDF